MAGTTGRVLGAMAVALMTLVAVTCSGSSGGGGGGADAGAGGTASCPPGQILCFQQGAALQCVDSVSAQSTNCGACGVVCGTTLGTPADSTCVSGPLGGKCGQTWLKISPSKPTYASGEQIVLNVTYTNTGITPCKLINLTEGNLTIGSMTLDGNPVVPVTSVATFYAGMTEFLLKYLVTVPANSSTMVQWKSQDWAESHFAYTLETASVTWGDSADVAYWPVLQKGQYALAVNYTPPPLAWGTPDDLCKFTDTAFVTFTVN